MIEQKCIPLDSEKEWDDALKGIRHSFAHTWENCYAMSLTTGLRTFLYSYKNEDTRIICPFAERDFKGYTDIVTPYGFSGFTGNGNSSKFTDHWNEFVKERKYICGYISLNPLLQHDAYFKKEDGFKSTNLYFIDLNLSLTELFENLDANRKKQIKDYRSVESAFVYDRKILTEFFIDNYYDFLKRTNASEANYFSKETLDYLCSLDKLYMVGVGKQGKIKAVFIFGYTDFIGDCLFNVALPEGREYSPFLLWSGLKFFRKKKIPVMSLGGGIKEDDSVALSKERFGSYKLPFINLKQIYNKDIYNKLCSEQGKDPDNIEGYFPAYRKKNISD
ncbi:MAG: hypothetical protein H0W84_08855 [Bacteroidetes bacterium]|nr:hypothetical protein [Bacteroidota bacterium]